MFVENESFEESGAFACECDAEKERLLCMRR
jgi:hypothetical protein